jgi:hypothetical protein
VEYWLKELQESMNAHHGCFCSCDKTEMMLKTALKHHTINQSINQLCALQDKILDFSNFKEY